MFEAFKNDFAFRRSTSTVEATNLPQAHAELDLTSMAKLTEQFGFAKDADEFTGSRTLRVLAFDILEPITSLQGKAFWKAYWEIIKCHYMLWKGGIQHGDISVFNLMHHNGTGVLNDFDLSRFITPGVLHPRGFDRTGTKPFLALDLLTADAQNGKVERRYRHDLESFLWVLMWIIACYDSGVESIPTVYRPWLQEDTDMCLGAKTVALNNERLIYQTTTQSYRFLGPVMVILQDHWQEFYDQRRKEVRPSKFDRALIEFAESSDLPSPSTPAVAIEPSDEQVLFNLLHSISSNRIADHIRSSGLMDDIPFALFPTLGHF